MGFIQSCITVFATALLAASLFYSFGTYHDNRTRNMVRTNFQAPQIGVEGTDDYFGMRQLCAPTKCPAPQPEMAKLPAVLFLHGHMGIFKQVANLVAQTQARSPVAFYATDCQISPAGFSVDAIDRQARFVAEWIPASKKTFLFSCK
jgi:hypothetical protein